MSSQYLDAIPQEAITDMSDVKEREDLQQHLSERKNIDITEYIKQQRFKSIFDACVDVLRDGDSGSEKAFKDWVTRDGPMEFLTVCTNHSQFKLNPSFADQVHEFAKKVYEKELMALSKASEFKPSSRSLVEASNMSFHPSWTQAETNAPRLSSLLESLTTLPRNSNKSAVGIISTNPSTDINSESECDNVESNTSVNLAASSTKQLSTRKERRRRRRQRWILTVTSGLLHCRSQKINKLAFQVGYHLFATKTPKCAIEILHHQGVFIVT